MVLRLYTDASILPAGVPHVPMLVPFMGAIDPPESPEHTRFDRYAELGKALFAVSSLAEADVAVLPFGWESVLADRSLEDRAQRFADSVRRAGKRLIVFCESDSAEPVPLYGATVYRTSLYRSTRSATEHAMPGWTGDLSVFRGAPLSAVVRGERPIAGFLGNVSPRSQSVLSSARVELLHAIGRATGQPHSWHARATYAKARARAVEILETSPLIDARVERETRFAGGSMRPDGTFDWEILRAARERFVRHADSCDYLLSVRGGGNFSYRFYEAMCLGKIPLFVDTECVLPFDEIVDWRSRMVWVDSSALGELPDKLVAFDRALDTGSRAARQSDARAAWERWLSPEGFFATLATELP